MQKNVCAETVRFRNGVLFRSDVHGKLSRPSVRARVCKRRGLFRGPVRPDEPVVRFVLYAEQPERLQVSSAVPAYQKHTRRR